MIHKSNKIQTKRIIDKFLYKHSCEILNKIYANKIQEHIKIENYFFKIGEVFWNFNGIALNL